MSTLPKWEEFLLPVLRVLSDGVEHSAPTLKAEVAALVGLTPEQRAELLDSGGSRAYNRIGWALSFLARAQALERPSRGNYLITDGGRALVEKYPGGFAEKDLKAIPAYREYVPVSRTKTSAAIGDGPGSSPGEDPQAKGLDPVEEIEQGVQRLNSLVRAQLLDRLQSLHPDFLEQAVLKVLIAMGYGGAESQARRIGGVGDGGVDGVIDQDALGLDQVYVQAKRYAADNPVGREAIQAFVGALQGNQASRGVFITTSRFTPGAREYASKVNLRIILIDGERLSALMIKYGVGVQTKQTYAVTELDEDFFE